MLDKIEEYFSTVGKWETELRKLDEIAVNNHLEASYKWKHPCYTYKGKNIAIIGEFNHFCSITFFKGVLMKDPNNILRPVTKNVQADRLLEIKSLEQLESLELVLGEYIKEAIEIEKSGKQVQMKSTEDYDVPKELESMFKEIPEFEEAFKKLTPGRQRGYLLHYASAKQSKTRTSRIEKSMERVLLGKGIHECICGKSKHMPRCDGSHKLLE